MKRRAKKIIVITIVVMTLLPAIFLYLHEGGWNIVELIRLIFLKLGSLGLVGIFILKLRKAYKNGQNTIRTMCGAAIVVFVGGGWILQFTSEFLCSVLYSIIG